MDKISTNKTNRQMVENRSQQQKLLQHKMKVGWGAIKGRINLVPTQNSPTDLCLQLLISLEQVYLQMWILEVRYLISKIDKTCKIKFKTNGGLGSLIATHPHPALWRLTFNTTFYILHCGC